MRRRSLLAAVGGALAAGVAGCVADGSDSPGGGPGGDDTTTDGTTTRDDTTTDDPTTTPGDPTPDPGGSTNWGPDTPSPFETAAVGSREGVAFPENHLPHVVRVWNAASEPRSIGLALTDDAGQSAFDGEFEFPADGWVRLTLNEPAAYDLAVTVAGGSGGSVAVELGTFDCNDSVTNVAVDAEGAVDSTTVSTQVGCPGPAIAGESFSVGEGGCGTRDEATATFADGAVGVEGSIRTPNPCYDLALAEVRLLGAEDVADGTDDVLELVVATDGTTGEMCTECVGTVAYEASVEFENEYPSNVRVVHESERGRRTVLETAR